MILIKRNIVIEDNYNEYTETYYFWYDVLADDYRKLLKSRGRDDDYIEDEILMLNNYINDVINDYEEIDDIEDIQNQEQYEEFYEYFLEFIHYNIDNDE